MAQWVYHMPRRKTATELLSPISPAAYFSSAALVMTNHVSSALAHGLSVPTAQLPSWAQQHPDWCQPSSVPAHRVWVHPSGWQPCSLLSVCVIFPFSCSCVQLWASLKQLRDLLRLLHGAGRSAWPPGAVGAVLGGFHCYENWARPGPSEITAYNYYSLILFFFFRPLFFFFFLILFFNTYAPALFRCLMSTA